MTWALLILGVSTLIGILAGRFINEGMGEDDE